VEAAVAGSADRRRWWATTCSWSNGRRRRRTDIHRGNRGSTIQAHKHVGQPSSIAVTGSADRRRWSSTTYDFIGYSRDKGRRSTTTKDCIGHSRFNGGQASYVTVTRSADHRRWWATVHDWTALSMEASKQSGWTNTWSMDQQRQASSVGYWTSSSQYSRRTAGQWCRSTTTYDCKQASWSTDDEVICLFRRGLSRTTNYVKSRYKHVNQRRRLDLWRISTFVDLSIGWRPITEYGLRKQDEDGFEDCGTRQRSRTQQHHRFYGAGTCGPGRTSGFQRGGSHCTFRDRLIWATVGTTISRVCIWWKLYKPSLLRQSSSSESGGSQPAGGPGQRRRRRGTGNLLGRPTRPLQWRPTWGHSHVIRSDTKCDQGRRRSRSHRRTQEQLQGVSDGKDGLEHHPEHRFSDARRELTRAPSGATRGVDKGDEQRQSTWTTADGGRRQESSSTSSDASSRQSKNVLDKQDKRATAVTSTPKHQSSSLSGTQNASAARNSAGVATSDS